MQRLEVVGKHAAPALYNAAQMKRVPLKFLWWPIAKLQEGIGGKGRFYAIAGADPAGAHRRLHDRGALPAARWRRRGTLQPVEIARCSPRARGRSAGIRCKPGEKVGPDDAVVDLLQLGACRRNTPSSTNATCQVRAVETQRTLGRSTTRYRPKLTESGWNWNSN